MRPTTSTFAAFPVSLLVLCSFGSTGQSQGVVLHRDAFASSGGQSFKNLVRDEEGTLYCVSILQTTEEAHQVIVQASEDEGRTWKQDPFVFNDETSGLGPPVPTNRCAVAIDDRGVLHVTWGNYSYPSSYRQFYRNWDPASGEASEVFDLSAWMAAPLTARTAANDIALDQDGTVWLVAHGPQSWVEHLVYSPAPYAEGFEFVDVGRISPSASAQTTRIAMDTSGRVHCVFYRNTGAGQFEHRMFDPATGWGESTNLGNTTPENDVWGTMATDALGNVHVLFAEDGTDNSPLWRFLYRRWDEASGWGEAVSLVDVEAALREGVANTHIFTLGCDESTGLVTVLYRDLTRGGALGTVAKPIDGGFGEFVDLAPPTADLHAYYSPAIRGRLYPESDRTSHGLHATYQYRAEPGVPPYSLDFVAIGGSGAQRFRRGDADDNGGVNITDAIFALSALFLEGAAFPGCVDAADSNDDGQFNLSDGVYTLNSLFTGGPLPPGPGVEECGDDPTADDIGCERYTSC